MSDFATLVQKPNTEKILLFEIDIEHPDDFWTNYQAFVWYVNFANFYPDLEAWMYAGVDTRIVTGVGSVTLDKVQIPSVAAKADVQSTDPSFHYAASERALYLRCPDGVEPNRFDIVIGLAWGFKKGGTRNVYNNFIYENRLRTVPSISKSKDPLFFGKIVFEGGNVEIENRDGEFDQFAETNDVFGNSGRLLWGFDDLDYDEFRPGFSGFLETIEIGPSKMSLRLQDKRKKLSEPVPANVFTTAVYPDIKPSNVGKAIPVGWGAMLNTPVICTNEDEGGGPANYHFHLCDTTNHPINAITTVRVGGVVKAPSATDLAAGTFDLATADYDPGDEVTVDWRGFDDGSLIENAADVIADMLESYSGLDFNSTFFNLTEWNSADAYDIGLFVDTKTKVVNLIEQISAGAQGDFIADDDGKYSFRIYDENAPIVQIIARDELLEVPVVSYDPTEVLSSITVGYAKDWKEKTYTLIDDNSSEDEVFEKFKIKRDKTFETLLTKLADAQAFATKQLSLSDDVRRIFRVKLKTQALERELGDFIQVAVKRQTGQFIGNVKAEIIGINKDGNNMQIGLTCRVVELLPEVIYMQGIVYNDSYYDDAVYGRSHLGEV